jgi:MinD superfamily P-loop ATPase
MKKITILSGKGGVGKSSITASLGVILSKKYKIILADCDVDAPNLALVFGKKEKDFLEWSDISTNQKAVFDLDKCNSCQKCYKACYFNAIDWIDNKPQLKKFSCEGCGIADIICPVGAIKLVDVKNAKIGHVYTKYGFDVVSSQLNIGESGSGKLVAEVKNKAKELANDSEIMLVDSAAGIGCPVIASVSGSDYCVLIVEPTPSSFYDMKKALDVINHFKINSGIIVNKFDINKKYLEEIKKFAKNKKIKIIGELPYDKDFIRALVDMVPVVEKSDKQKKIFSKILDNLLIDCNLTK